MLLKFQEELELPLHRVLQENNTRWWSILLMMQSIMDNIAAIIVVLGNNSKNHLILNLSEQTSINLIIKLLKPFKECGEKLSSETNVTISLPCGHKTLWQHCKNIGKHLKLVEE